MKYLITLILLPTFAFASVECNEQVTVKVSGLVCEFCAVALEETLGKEDGVSDIKISLEKGELYFKVAKGSVMTEERARELILDAGNTPREFSRQCLE